MPQAKQTLTDAISLCFPTFQNIKDAAAAGNSTNVALAARYGQNAMFLLLEASSAVDPDGRLARDFGLEALNLIDAAVEAKTAAAVALTTSAKTFLSTLPEPIVLTEDAKSQAEKLGDLLADYMIGRMDDFAADPSTRGPSASAVTLCSTAGQLVRQGEKVYCGYAFPSHQIIDLFVDITINAERKELSKYAGNHLADVMATAHTLFEAAKKLAGK